MEMYELPNTIKLSWFNFLEGDDSDTPWVHCGGKSLVSELGFFGLEMDVNMDEFDQSITTDPKVISWLAQYFNVLEEEIAGIKYAMGFVLGQYENNGECEFGND